MYSVDVDQSTAKQLVKEGGTLLLLGVPGGTVVGYDQQASSLGVYANRASQHYRLQGLPLSAVHADTYRGSEILWSEDAPAWTAHHSLQQRQLLRRALAFHQLLRLS